MTWEYTKQFWIKTIEEARRVWSFPEGEEFSVPDWEDAINKTKTYQTLNELGRKLRREAASKWNGYLPSVPILATSEERELNETVAEDVKTLEIAVEVAKNEYSSSKTSDEAHKSTIEEYQSKLKSIIGSNDLTNWETKLVKAGSSDKDITDLQKKISDLTTAKDNLDQQLKAKQQQILDHRCDTPNNAELNQTKEELDKANQEITSLKEQLGNKPNSPSDKEEERKEELENSKLSLEQLREKLKTTQAEVRNLRTQLSQQKKQVNRHNSYSLGTLFVVGVVCLFFGSLVMFIAKKKKQTS